MLVTLVEGVWDKMKKLGENKWLEVNWEDLYKFSNIKMMVTHKTLTMVLAFTYSKLFGEQMLERSICEMMSFLLEVKLLFIKTQTLNKNGSCYICNHKTHFIVFF
jgi:hypothetical protein